MIQREDELALLVEKMAPTNWVSVDTEADSLHAYPEKLCVLQLSFDGGDELVDPLAGMDLAPLMDLLRQKSLIIHGADYDLRLLYRAFGFVPAQVFDTMWAARLLGVGAFGLADLTDRFLGVTLAKGSQKANWARRPLTPIMVEYAQNDTRYLKMLADALRGELVRLGRLDWLNQCCVQVATEARSQPKPDPDIIWRLKGSDWLDRGALAVLRELWGWREQAAVAANRPPYFILSHEVVSQLAATAAQQRPWGHLLPQRMSPARRQGVIEAIERGLKLPSAEWPRPLRRDRRSLPHSQRARLAELRTLRDHRASELGIDSTLIASKAMLVRLADNWEAGLSELLPWQRELLLPRGRTSG